MKMKEIAMEKIWKADLILLALGFIGPEKNILDNFGISLNKELNIESAYGEFTTNVEGVFSAGDARRGQSLVVWAMNEGRGQLSKLIDIFKGKQTFSTNA